MRNTATRLLSPAVWIILVGTLSLLALTPALVHAAQTCDEAGLDAAIAAGGVQTFNCVSATTITISGPKIIPGDLTLDGGGLLTISGGDQYQIFTNVMSLTLTLQNLALVHGNSTSANSDGGALHISTLVVNNVTFDHNHSPLNGGAIGPGNMTITNSTFTNNTAGVSGGAVSATIDTLSGSVFTGNQAATGNGGAIDYAGNEFNLSNNTFSNNQAAGSGGAVYANLNLLNMLGNSFLNNSASNGGALFFITGVANIANSTFGGNSASGNGGALVSSGTLGLLVTNSTFVSNSAAQGGTLYFDRNSPVGLATGSFQLQDSIVSGGSCIYYDGPPSTWFNGSGNLTSDTTCPGHNGWVTGLAASAADNGGATPTYALLPGSDAIDAALTCKYQSNKGPLSFNSNPLFNNGAPITTDQRGVSRDTPCDVGAYEYYQTTQLSTTRKIGSGDTDALGAAHPGDVQTQNFTIVNHNASAISLTSPASLPQGCTLTTTFPTSVGAHGSAAFGLQCANANPGVYQAAVSFTTSDPNYSSYIFTLEYSVQPPGVVGSGTLESCDDAALALELAGGGSITFNCGGTETIPIHSAKIVTTNASVDGGGQITLSGGGLAQVFVVYPGGTLTLQNLTITDGFALGYSTSPVYNSGGGAIMNNGTLTLDHVTLSNNEAVKGGDSRGGLGGAIANNGIANVSNSTLSGNSAVGGGGLYNFPGATANILASTINGNTSPASGAGIYDQDAILNIANSTFSGNTTDSFGSAVAAGDGGSFTAPFDVRIANSTFANNVSGAAGGALNSLAALTSSSMIIQNSVFSGNTGGDCLKSGVTANVFTGTKNQSADTHCPGKLGALTAFNATLAGNGGLTATHALLAGSNAVGAGGATCTFLSSGTNPLFSDNTPITLDQRGRPRFNGCDLGAYELTAPVITTQLADQVIISGTTAGLNVVADNGPGVTMTYQWYQGAALDTSNPLGTSTTQTTPTLNAQAQFWVRITNDYVPPDSTDSRVATVSMNVPPQITVQPTSQNVNFGLKVTLSVQATGLALIYQWYEGSSGDTSQPIAGAVQQTYTTPPLFHNRSFWVRVSNLETADSAAADITVVSPSNATPVTAYFTTGSPTLTWSPVTGATGYQLQIASATSFAQAALVYESGTLAPDKLFDGPNTPLGAGIYYWRVQALEPDGTTWGGWSQIQTFIVDVP